MSSYQDLGLANAADLMKKAYAGRYAVPAFNFVCLEQMLAIMDACSELKSPFILQASANVCDYMGYIVVEHIAAACKATMNSRGQDVPMALNLDHGHTFEHCAEAIAHGFSAVMIDGSALPFEENIQLTRCVVEYAHARGVSVEGELGVLSGNESTEETEGGEASGQKFTDPGKVKEFVQRTGVDCLAISIGTCHGVVKVRPNPDGTLPELRFDILAKIEEIIPGFPIVLHGSSAIKKKYVDMINAYGGSLKEAQGIPEEQAARAAQTAICKINVASDGWIAATAATRRALAERPDAIDPRAFLKEARKEMTNVYKDKILSVMGSAHRA